MRNLPLLVFVAVVSVAQQPPDAASAITSALRAKQYEQALSLAQSALEHAPADVRILALKAMALTALGKDGEALATYRQALQLKPDYLAALEGAAQIEYKEGSNRANSLLDHLLSLQPNNSTAHAMRAVMAWKEHDCKAAVNHFGLAGDAISASEGALEEYIGCLARLDRPADAIPVLRQLMALQPGNRRVRYRLAAAQFMAKSYAEAAETLGPLVSGQDADPDALDLASVAWEALGDTPRAVAALRQAIVLAPTDIKLYVDFASLCMVHKSYDAGIKMIDAGLARSPNAAPLYLARGVLYVQIAQYDQADADFATGERLDPRQTYGSFARGLAQVQNDLGKALPTVRARLKAHPRDPFLNYLLAEVLSSQGAQPGSPEFREAIAAASRAVALKPDFSLARDILSRLYLSSGQTSQAIQQCRLALRDNPMDATALYRLMRALQKSGDASAAEEIPGLLKRFNEVRQQIDKQEAEDARYTVVAGLAASEQPHSAPDRSKQ